MYSMVDEPDVRGGLRSLTTHSLDSRDSGVVLMYTTTMKRDVEYSIVIPTLNEEGIIGEVLDRIPPRIMKKGEVIVADASTDRTAAVARGRGAQVVRSKKSGKGYQLKMGVQHARGRVLIMMDGDGEHPPEYIPRLIKKLDQGFDVVVGTRTRGSTRSNVVIRAIYYLYLPIIRSLFKGAGVSFQGTPLSGFRCMDRATWDSISPHDDEFLLETQMNVNMGEKSLRIGEVHIPFVERHDGITQSRVFRHGQIRRIVGFIISYILNVRVKEGVTRKYRGFKKELCKPARLCIVQFLNRISGGRT
jgi:glycosyltransferase involved in cell wall biosynthesis